MARAQTLGARVRMRDGRLVKLRGSVRLCLAQSAPAFAGATVSIAAA